MYENFIKITGNRDGGTSIILAGVHGNEKGGVAALKDASSSLLIECGTVIIGYGNPRAIEEDIRHTEANLNRMFRPEDLITATERQSYEYKRAQFLKTYLNEADALLDVHESSNPDSKPFAICEENAAKIARHLPVDTVVSGFDAIEPGGTDFYMNSIGKIGICVECGYLGDPGTADVAKKSIRAFLSARGHLPESESDADLKRENRQTHILMDSLYITKTDTFTLSKYFKDFEEITKGQVIGTDGQSEITAQDDGVILFAKNRSRAGEEAFLLGKKK